MASCKECIHFDRCKGLYKFDRLQKAVSKGCSYFKDRSRFVELDPCEGGEIITLEDAIAHCYEVADGKANACEECRAEHMMLGAWLRELKLRREQEMQMFVQ